MSTVLDSVVKNIAGYTKVQYFTPPNGSISYTSFLLNSYAAETARKSAIYDRTGNVPTSSYVSEGDIMVFADRKFIVASVHNDIVYGSEISKAVALTYVNFSVDITRLTATNGDNYLEGVENIVYSDVPIAVRVVEEDVVKKFETIKEKLRVFLPKYYTVNLKDIIKIPDLGDFTVETVVPFVGGLVTVDVVERRI
jgi:hypothetical protein